MKKEEVINVLDKFNDSEINDIYKKIEEIKSNRQNQRCYDAVETLNELLNSMEEILKEFKKSGNIADAPEYLIGNQFYVGKDEDGIFIDLKY